MTVEEDVDRLLQNDKHKVVKKHFKFNSRNFLICFGSFSISALLVTMLVLPVSREWMQETFFAREEPLSSLGDTASYYFDDFNVGEVWGLNPANMVDGNIGTFARDNAVGGATQLCDNNTCDGTDLGTISKVELRAYGEWSTTPGDADLVAVFVGGDGDGDACGWGINPSWSNWFDITEDANAPDPWTWNAVQNLDCDVVGHPAMFASVECYKVEINVTYSTAPSRTWQDIGSMYWNLSFSNTTVNRDIGNMYFNISFSNTTINENIGNMDFNISFGNTTVNNNLGSMDFNISFGNTTIYRNVGSLDFNVSFGNSSVPRAWQDIGSMYFNISMGNTTTHTGIGNMDFNVSFGNSTLALAWYPIGNMYFNISFSNSSDELVWIEPGIYFDIDSDNDRFSMNKTLGFTQIVINETWIKFNDTSFNITAGAFINISLTHIDDTPTVNTNDELVCGFWANTTTGTVWFNISGFSNSGAYYVNLNGSTLGNYDSNITGVISFSHSGSGNRLYEIYNGTTAAVRSWQDIGSMYYNISFSNLILNEDIGNMNFNVSFGNTTINTGIGNMDFNVSFSNSSFRAWLDIGSLNFNVSFGNTTVNRDIGNMDFNVSFSNTSVRTWQDIGSMYWNVSFSNTTIYENIGSMYFNVSFSNSSAALAWYPIGNMYWGISFSNSSPPTINISLEYPDNNNTIQDTQPMVFFNLTSPQGYVMNYSIYIGNGTGNCTTLLHSEVNVSNGTQWDSSQVYFGATDHYEKYYWRVQVNDGYSYINETYSFEAILQGGGGITSRLGTAIAMGLLSGLGGSIIFGLLFIKKKKEWRR